MRICCRARLAPGVLAAAVIAVGLASPTAIAGPAYAAASARIGAVTWTVTPGGDITGKSGKVTFEDTVTDAIVSCDSSAESGTLESGSGLSGTDIGYVTSVTYTKCVGPLGMIFSIQASAATSPWQLNAGSYDATSGVTMGTITNVQATLSSPSCDAIVAGSSATSGGTVKITYANGTDKLKILTSGATLQAWNVSGCSGLFNSGDPMTMCVIDKVTPAQTFIGLPADLGPDTSGTGPPC
jgi:hypothetical protein